MVCVDDYKEERSCIYRDEEYLVRDNGAVLRKSRKNKRKRRLDDYWTFGNMNIKTGYLEIASERVHRIVATAFHGDPPTKEHIVDHIDTNRQNNRPDNLRWITRLENVVLNEATRHRIEHLTGVHIFVFLQNPSKYRHLLERTEMSWMRRVTEEEAKNCLNHVNQMSRKGRKSSIRLGKTSSDWMYKPVHRSYDDGLGLKDSLTPLAQQKNWRTLTKFVCCPEKIGENPIEDYLKKLEGASVLAVNHYGESRIEKYAAVGDNLIVVLCSTDNSVKPFALTEITFENGRFVHKSKGSFFLYEGAEKRFVLAQGLVWEGEDSIDDYC